MGGTIAVVLTATFNLKRASACIRKHCDGSERVPNCVADLAPNKKDDDRRPGGREEQTSLGFCNVVQVGGEEKHII